MPPSGGFLWAKIMADVAALGLKVEGVDSIDRASDSLNRLVGASDSAEKSTDKLANKSDDGKRALDGFSGSANKASSIVNQLGAAALKAGAMIGAALGINAIKNYADSWSDMQSVVGAAIGDMSKAAGMMTKLVDIANASYSPLEQTAQVYASNVSALRDLGRGAIDAAKYTESLNHMLVLTATRGERATSVQNALSKAMAVGKLQADGLETVLANGGEVAAALARELNTTVSGLRAMASQGKITSDVIANSVIKSLDDVRDRAGEMPATMGDAFTRMQNNLTEFIGRIDKASGASSAMADAILGFADRIRSAGDYVIAFGAWASPIFNTVSTVITKVAQYADIAVAALAGFFAPALVGGVTLLSTSLAVGLVSAIKAVTAAMMANPIGLLVGALAAAVYAVYKFRDNIKQAIGVDVVAITKSAANFVIGSFVAAYEDIKFVWNNFGSMMGAAVIGGVNFAIDAINKLISGALSGINSLIGAIRKIPGLGDIGDIGEGLQIPRLENKPSERLAGAAAERNKAYSDAMSKDYIGAAFSGFKLPETSDQEELAGAIPMAPGSPTAGGGGKGSAADKEAEDYASRLALQQGFLENRLAAEQKDFDYRNELLMERFQNGLIQDEEFGIEKLALMTEEQDLINQMLNDKFIMRMEELSLLREAGKISDEEYKIQSLEAEMAHQDQLTDIERQALEERERLNKQAAQAKSNLDQAAFNMSVGLLQQLGQKSKAAAIAAIALQKIQAIAQIKIATGTAAMLAYASQLIPGDPSSLARAAAAAASAKAMGALNMALVVATGLVEAASLGGGSGSGSSSGRSSSTYTAPITRQQEVEEKQKTNTIVTINMTGETYSKKQVRELIEHINDAVSDGATLRLA